MATKEVRFDEFCPKCKHWDKQESEDPCFDCLNQGWNEDSHRPIFFDENKNLTNKEKRA